MFFLQMLVKIKSGKEAISRSYLLLEIIFSMDFLFLENPTIWAKDKHSLWQWQVQLLTMGRFI